MSDVVKILLYSFFIVVFGVLVRVLIACFTSVTLNTQI